jgi:hypothetical protein
MIIFPYPKPTKCYGDTVIRHAEKTDIRTYNKSARPTRQVGSVFHNKKNGGPLSSPFLCLQDS